MKHFGITGNIGSGKSTACMVFEQLGARIFYADLMAKQAYQMPEVQFQLIQRFGKKIYDRKKQLNKAMLAALIFDDDQHLQFVNALIHPQVHLMYEDWKTAQTEAPYTLYEAAILFETGVHRHFDGVILVSAPESLRIQRVMERSGLSAGEVANRMRHQWAESKKIPLADFVIYNDQQQLLLPQILAIHHKLLGDA